MDLLLECFGFGIAELFFHVTLETGIRALEMAIFVAPDLGMTLHILWRELCRRV